MSDPTAFGVDEISLTDHQLAGYTTFQDVIETADNRSNELGVDH
jgi:hypothetical protein